MMHTVVRGDSLWKLARLYGVSWQEIARVNSIKAPYVLSVGQVLVIPGQQAPEPEAALTIINEPVAYTIHKWRRYEPIRWLIIHDPVGGSVANTLAYLRRNDKGVSYNELLVPWPGSGVKAPLAHMLTSPEFYVGHAGYSTFPDGTRGPACNRASWGLCIYKAAADEGPFHPSLEQAAIRLAIIRCRQFGVPADRVLAHREVDPKRRRDPRGLDMARFRESVARGL